MFDEIKIGSQVSHSIHGSGTVLNIICDQLEVSFFGGVCKTVSRWEVVKKSKLF